MIIIQVHSLSVTSCQVHKSQNNLIRRHVLALSLPPLVVVVDKLAEQRVVGTIAARGAGPGAGGSRGAVAQQAMTEVHGAQALHPTLQVAVNRTAVGEGLVHQLLLIALLTLLGQDVQAAGRDAQWGISSGRDSLWGHAGGLLVGCTCLASWNQHYSFGLDIFSTTKIDLERGIM